MRFKKSMTRFKKKKRGGGNDSSGKMPQKGKITDKSAQQIISI